MSNYVGIDLGTTNSAICSFDGESIKLYKSPDQNDVTSSAIFLDKRGNKYLGKRAYDNSARNPDNAATLFKRLMGTSTPIKLPAVNVTMTPEECSAEILKLLFGYLPEEIRNSGSTGTVITVPAAFNQMQKDSTMSASDLAGIGNVALMQEPVAAVMSVMRSRKSDGIFLVYDLGGGTLDIAIAQSLSSRVSLLAHGGIEMCGGRDFDRLILDNVVKPWLLDSFDLPEDFTVFTSYPQYKSLVRMATWAAEKAKIELSSKPDAIIQLSEAELGIRDISGEEIYLDVPFNRQQLDSLIAAKLDDSIQTARETMEKAGLCSHDIERVVFVGGPTNYKPMRDKVAFELGIAASTDINPMTAVAEGAAVFAESIDWSSQSRNRKSSRGSVSVGSHLNISFNFISRTPDSKAKIAVKVAGSVLAGTELQIESLDTGWSSGRLPLKDGATFDVMLTKPGENTFKIWVFDATGGPITLEQNKIVITRTAATIDAIPSSSSIGIEVLDKLGGRPVLEYLVKEGDPLPQKGARKFKATESLRAGSSGSINFKIWEGNIGDVITDNRFIGSLTIKGTDIEDGAIISAGAELVCEYEVLDSGNVRLEVTVPSIGGAFDSGRNFYSRQDGAIDYSSASKQVLEDAETMRGRVEAASSKVDNPKLDQALAKLDSASSINNNETNPETTKQAMDNILEAKKLLAEVRKTHLGEIRQLDLDRCCQFFNDCIMQYARPTEISAFENLKRSAQRVINNVSNDFENYLDEMKGKNFVILWRQDWFVIDRFNSLAEESYRFANKQRHAELVALGRQVIATDEIDKLRQIVYELDSIKIGYSTDSDLMAAANIVKG
jgi:molecular chaperone DnaK